MSRPKSESKRSAILTAATGLIAEQGLGAATAEIAKRAGVPQGSVFTYFATKAELFNALYQELSAELTDTVMADMPSKKDPQVQFRHLWVRWTAWGVSNPSKRRAQSQLKVSDLVKKQTLDSAYKYAAPVYDLIQRASAQGALRDAPWIYVGALIHDWAATTTDFMISHPLEADQYCKRGFDTIWRALN
jgi:AcrR family transcriptional regulator